MADEGEVDVLGDFDFKLEASGGMYDENELPSKSANLLPEYTNPPWMLEQGWPMDSSMDEKSKATIEKMLMEEQYYINGKVSSRAKQRMTLQSALGQAGISKKMVPQTKKEEVKKWTDNEKDMFKRGLEIFGRSWTKIAELIPSKTALQIKNYSYQYFKQNKSVSETEPAPVEATATGPVTSAKDPLGEVLVTVSTAKPTISTIKPIVPRKGRIPKSEKGLPLIKQQNSLLKKKAAVTKLSPPKPKKNVCVKGSSERLKRTEQQDFVNGDSKLLLDDKRCVDSVISSSLDNTALDQKLTITHGLIENLEGFCAVADILAGSQAETVDRFSNEDENEDDDVDIENDDDDGVNPLLQGRSVSPNSVYERLLAEANLKASASEECKTIPVDTPDGTCALTDEIMKTESCTANLLHVESEVTDNDTKLDASCIENMEVNVQKESEVELSTITNVDSTILVDLPESGDEPDNDVKESDHLNDMTETAGSSSEPVDSEEKLYDRVPEKTEPEKVFMNVVCNCDGEIIHFPFPQEEAILLPEAVSEDEKLVHKDFFETKRPSSKNPDRYLKIRNYILDSWKKSKPTYLNKTSVRPGLKNCGDVNCIGRVHTYLECIGAINFGCEQAAYKHARPAVLTFNKERTNKDSMGEVNAAKLEAMRPRKRKVKDAFGLWIDEKELEGKTIEHMLKTEEGSKEVKQKSIKSGYDPFKLVPCLPFDQEHLAPFLMEVHKSALIVMDIHSHMCKTEVIGMLGGHFCLEDRKLTVTMATPCNSISTGMQCEMDPVSQTQAQEEIQGCGMDVVGWYHSHPSFAPNPSVRDIETQLKFQDWFSQGGSNFVGMIVSPYNPRSPRFSSEITCLTISDEVLPLLQCNIPFKFDYSTRECSPEEMNTILLIAQDLSTSYATYPNKVDLLSPFSCNVTCLHKMLESVKVHLPDCDTSGLVNNLKKIFLSCDYESVTQSGELNNDQHVELNSDQSVLQSKEFISYQTVDSSQDVDCNQASTSLPAMVTIAPTLPLYPVVMETLPDDLISACLSQEVT